jgi:hypothetical protein
LRVARRALDDPRAILAVGVRDDEQMALGRMAERQKAVLIAGVIGVGKGDGQRVAEDRCRLAEGDAVPGEIAGRLVGISLELHEGIVSRRDPPSKEAVFFAA